MNSTPPASADPFSRLSLPAVFLQTLDQLGYHTMTPIQAAALPLALAGRDLIAQAETGSGKTAAFGLPLLTKLNPRWFAVQGLVLCPTRELADQVAIHLRQLARGLENIKILTLCGGVGLWRQNDSLAHGAHLVVGTPGRILDHLQRGTLKLEGVRTLVLDEADRMLDMGFVDDMVAIARFCPSDRQTLLFSATFPAGIEQVAAQLLRQPERIKVAPLHTVAKIDQRFCEVDRAAKLEALIQLLRHFRPVSTVVFCNLKVDCRTVVDGLQAAGISALELSGDLEQRDRDEVLARFAGRGVSVLVATDVASRGLDIDQLAAVINYDLTPDVEVHTHRVGRTGRAGADGLALSLVGSKQRPLVERIAAFQQAPAVWQALADLPPVSAEPLLPPMGILQIAAGKRDKLRPGDVLGALTADLGYGRDQVGKIKVTDYSTYVAVDRSIAADVLDRLSRTQIKGRPVRVRLF